MRNHARRFLSLVAISLLPTLAAAQEVNNGNQTGFPVWGSFHGSAMDNVSLSNGNLHIEIPILSAKERGGRTLTYRFIYDTPTWVLVWFPPPDPTLQGYWMVGQAPYNYDEGWRLTDGESGWGLGNDVTTIQCTVNGVLTDVSVQNNFVVFGPDGTKHPTALAIQPTYVAPCVGNQLTSPTLDGTGIFVDITSGTKIKLKDGTDVSSGWKDSNGNIGPEMLGRSLLTATSNSGYDIWTTHDSNGNPQTFRVDYIFVPVQTTLCQFKRVVRETCYELSTSIYVPSKLTLPTGLTYQFQWDGNSGTADLIELDLPTGGAMKYAYQSTGWKNPEEDRHQTVNARRSVVTRTVVANGQSNSWSYSGYQSLPTGTVTTVVVDPLNNREEHDFTVLGTINIETQVRSYDSASHLLRTVSKDYASESHTHRIHRVHW